MSSDWKVEKLSDVCDFYNGKPHEKDIDENGHFIVINSKFISSDGKTYKKTNQALFPLFPGDIAMVMSDVPNGKALAKCFLVDNSDIYTLNQRICVIRSSHFDNKFLYYQLNRNKHFLSFNNGENQTNLRKKDILNCPLFVPPIEEQRRIVAVLDEALAGVQTAVANTERNLENGRELFASYLQSVFTNPTNDWEERKLGDSDLLQIIDGDRGTNYPQKKDFFEEGFCLFMNTKNVRPDGFDFKTTMFISREKDSALRKGKLERNDVVMTTRGTIGNLGVYSEDIKYDHIRINSGMLIFRPNVKLILPNYLFEVLRSGITKTQIEKHVSGAAQPQLPIKTLVDFSIPVPKSLDEQRAIVAQLDDLAAQTQQLEAIYQQKLAALDELKQSILQQAFSGGLDPKGFQNP